jgi:protein-S-isoprenylcysteine O-methyltransferase Ste14
MNVRLVASRASVVVVVGLALFTKHKWSEQGLADGALSAVGYTLLIAGALGRIWCAVHIAGRKNRELVVEGPFSIMRNPLYFFSMLAFVGAGLSFESITLAIAFGVVFFLTHWRTILLEERNLRGIFGPAYDEYLARVPRFLPNPRLYVPAGVVTLSVPVFMRALLEAGLIPLAFLGAQAVEAGHESGVLPAVLSLY